MQEIRDYIYSTIPKAGWYICLYAVAHKKHQWKFLEVGKMDAIQAKVRSLGKSFDAYHITNGFVLGLGNDMVPGIPPKKVYERATDVRSITCLGDGVPPIIYTTWGILYEEPNSTFPEPPMWRLIGNGLPTIAMLEEFRYRAKYDAVRVCKYDYKLNCLESCEMRIWDKKGVKIV